MTDRGSRKLGVGENSARQSSFPPLSLRRVSHVSLLTRRFIVQLIEVILVSQFLFTEGPSLLLHWTEHSDAVFLLNPRLCVLAVAGAGH